MVFESSNSVNRILLMKLPPYFHFLISLFFLLITGLLSYVDFDMFNSSQEQYISKVNQNLNEEFEIAHQSLSDFKQQIFAQNRDSVSFQNINYTGKYPVFVYKNDQLIYWSDYKYALSADMLTGKFIEFVTEGKNGIFGVVKGLARTHERYTLAIVVPIYQYYKIDNQYLKKSIYNTDIFPDDKTSVSLNTSEGMSIRATDGRYLFSVAFPENYTYSAIISQKDLLLITSLLVVFFALIQVRINLINYLKEGKIIEGLIWLAVSSVSIRLMMLFFNAPAGLTKYDLFNAKVYASSVISPSLGDLFLNVLLLFIVISYIYIHHHKIFRYNSFPLFSTVKKNIFTVIAFSCTFLALHLQYIILETIYFNSQIRLDISSDLNYGILKVSCFIIFLVTSFIYFFVCHIASHQIFLFHQKRNQTAVNLLVSTSIYLCISLFLSYFSPIVLVINLCYISAIIFLRLFRNIRSLSYSNYIYLFLSVFISALLGAYSNYIFEGRMDIANKENFASRILVGNDKLGEFLLRETIKKVQEDQIISTRMLSSLAPIDLVIQKIRKQHLDSYFDKYDTKVLLFNGNGNPYNYDIGYDTILTKFSLEKYKTEDTQIFFINDLPANAKRYLVFIDIQR